MPTLTQSETTQPQDEATADAWAAYLHTTRRCATSYYDEIEEHAWHLLQTQLEQAKA